MLGWCNTGHHTTCPVKVERWTHGFDGVGRKRVATIVHLGTYMECDCKCHKPKGSKTATKKKTRRK